MSETNKEQSKQLLIAVLMAVLIVFVAIQTWYITGMKKQLDKLHNQQPAIQSVKSETSLPETASSAASIPRYMPPGQTALRGPYSTRPSDQR